MSPVREKFVKIIETLPYDLEKEIYKRKAFDILKDVTQRYLDTYGINDLSKEDTDIIQNVLCNNFEILKKSEINYRKESD